MALDSKSKHALVNLQRVYVATAAWLAQLIGRETAEWEVAGSNPGWTTYQGL